MLKKTLVLTLTVGLISAVAGCNQNRRLIPELGPVNLECEGGGNSIGNIDINCRVGVQVRIRGKNGEIGAADFFSLTQGRFDFSRSNVTVASTGTNILLTAATPSGPQQATFVAVSVGTSARFADPNAVANWLASVEASSGVESIGAEVSGVQYVNQDGATALTVDIIADDGNLTVGTGAFNNYVRPGTISPIGEPTT
jgi:hypothetical protein